MRAPTLCRIRFDGTPEINEYISGNFARGAGWHCWKS
jgi:hypothetical protein